MFHFGFVKQGVAINGGTQLGVKDFFLDLRVNRQFLAYPLGYFLLFFAGSLEFAEFFISSKQLFDGNVIGIEQVNRVAFFGRCFSFGHGNPDRFGW